MKKFMLFCLMALGTMVSFTSCSDDDDNDIEQGEVSGKASFKESGDKMVATWSASYGTLSVKMVWTSTFNGNTLKSSVTEYTYPTADLAKQHYQDALEEGEKVSIKGNTVTEDMTEYYAEYDKDQMRVIMKQAVDEMNRHQ